MTEDGGRREDPGVREAGFARVIRVARRHAFRPLMLTLQLGVILVVTWIFLTDPGMNEFFASKFEDAIYGRSSQPYVYRALLPWTVQWITEATERTRYGVALLFHGNAFLSQLTARSKIPILKSLELVVFALLAVALFHVFAFSLRRTCKRLYAAAPLVSELLPLVALIALPSLFGYHNYIYDPGTLVFSALSLELLVARRWWWFVAAVAAGYFNKETIVLFVPLFAVHAFGKVPTRHYVAMLSALVVAFAVSRVVLNALFADYMGQYTIPQFLPHNLGLFRSYPVATTVAWLAVAVAIFGHWAHKPRVLKLGLLCHVPLFGACLLWGFFDELRDYYEPYPMLVLLMVPTVAAAMGHEVRLRPEA